MIKVKSGTRAVHVRIPAWVPAGDVTSKVNGTTVSNQWAGRYLLFTNLSGSETIEINFNVYNLREPSSH